MRPTKEPVIVGSLVRCSAAGKRHCRRDCLHAAEETAWSMMTSRPRAQSDTWMMASLKATENVQGRPGECDEKPSLVYIQLEHHPAAH